MPSNDIQVALPHTTHLTQKGTYSLTTSNIIIRDLKSIPEVYSSVVKDPLVSSSSKLLILLMCIILDISSKAMKEVFSLFLVKKGKKGSRFSEKWGPDEQEATHETKPRAKGPIHHFSLQTVHFKVHDPKMHCKGSSRENSISRYGRYGMRGPPTGRYDEEAPPPMHSHNVGPPPMGPPPMLPPMPPPPPPGPPMLPPPAPPPPNPECDMKDLNKMFGMTASDIDKYSRVIFPVTFTCFQLMYWIIYQHLSDDVVDDLVYLHPD